MFYIVINDGMLIEEVRWYDVTRCDVDVSYSVNQP